MFGFDADTEILEQGNDVGDPYVGEESLGGKHLLSWLIPQILAEGLAIDR